MTSKTAVFAAALLLAAGLGSPAAAQTAALPMPGPCAFAVQTEQGDAVKVLEDEPLCRRMGAYKAVFERLREAASFSPGQIKIFEEPLVVDNSSPNAYYRRQMIWVNWEFLTRFDADSAAAIQTLAHEIGHAVQDRENLLEYPRPLEKSRRIESQADVIAVELMARAGFKAPAEQSEEAFWGCAVIQTDLTSQNTHPAPGQRWLNALRAKSLDISKLGAAKAFSTATTLEDSGRAAFDGGPGPRAREAPSAAPPRVAVDSAGGRYRLSTSLADFDPEGRLVRGQAPLLDPRLSRRPSLSDIAFPKAPPPPNVAAKASAFDWAGGRALPNALDRPTGQWAAKWTIDVARRQLVGSFILPVLLPREDDKTVASIALRACGASAGLTYVEAVREGLNSMAGASADAFRRAYLGLSRPKPAPITP